MKHPLHLLLEAAGGMLPLLLLGIPEPLMAVLAFAVAVQLLLQHANVDMRMGPLRHVFAWAPVHRFHHMKYGTAGDVNFGLFLPSGTACWAPASTRRTIACGARTWVSAAVPIIPWPTCRN